MGKASTLDFTDKVFIEMREFDIGMSIANARFDYKSIYGEEVSEDYIKSLLMKDKRFIFINNRYFLLRDTLNTIKNEYGSNMVGMERFIKDKYFVNDIDRKVLLCNANNGNVAENNTMVLKFHDKVYEIINENDFYAAIIEEGAITFNATKAVCDYLKKDYYLMVKELENIGVNVHKDIECYAYKETSLSEAMGVDNGENILLLDLRTNEVVACLVIIYLLKANFKEINVQYFSDRHLSSLFKMNIIENYQSEGSINLTVYGERVIDEFEKFFNANYFRDDVVDEFNTLKYSKGLAKSKIIKELDCNELWNMISQPLREIYLNNEYSNTLLELIGEANEKEIYSLGDIILYHLGIGRYEDIRKIFIGKIATSGNKPIKNNTDICFNCRRFKCSEKMPISKSKLLFYRTNYVNNVIKEIEEDEKKLDILMKDPLIIKFIVPYLLCSRAKGLMMVIGFIRKDKIFMKESGEYCPFYDLWVINDDILV